MRLWRGIYRISILSLRLWRAHRIIIDESFNIKRGSQITEDHLNGSSNIQVLFDLRSFRANSDVSGLCFNEYIRTTKSCTILYMLHSIFRFFHARPSLI